jgi:hypothetical protein
VTRDCRFERNCTVDANRELYQKVQRLVGLGDAVQEHKVKVDEVRLATKGMSIAPFRVFE